MTTQIKTSERVADAHIVANPIVFFILTLPFGIISGYVTVTFAYLFSKAGISVEAVAALVGAAILPQVFKFLWAPLVDTFLSLKKWYILSCIVTAAGILATGVLPVKASSLAVFTIIIVVSNVAVSFLSTAVNSLSAHDTPHQSKGKVSGYVQAGNLGGTGLGGGAGLWLAQHLSHTWMPAAILAFMCLLCCLALLFISGHVSAVRAKKVGKTLENLFKDVWLTLKSRMGVFALVLCFLPLGTGAASNLWAAIASDWGASANTVALVTGLASGLITIVGCLSGGWLCDRIDRQTAYLIFGLSQAACAILMTFAPHTEMMYIIWTSVYAFSTGLAYAGFNAFVLEAIGKGAAGTKFAVYVSLSNVPIYFMTLIDGWAHTHYGPRGMLNIEAGCAILAAILFFALLKFSGQKNISEGLFSSPS